MMNHRLASLLLAFLLTMGIALLPRTSLALKGDPPLPMTLSPSWSATGNTAGTHIGGKSTVLQDGKVLVAGGDASNTITDLYDPASGTWSRTGDLNSARSAHTATLLPNGMVLVAGGTTDQSYTPVTTVELYNPATGAWTLTNALNTPRLAHTATLLTNGKVLVAGGIANGINLASAELYDPTTGMWSFTGSLNQSRRDYTATLLQNGKVLVAAGSGSFSFLSSAELYDPATGTWSLTGDTGLSRQTHTATLLPNSKVLVTGGIADFSFAPLNRADIYDPATGAWSQTGSLVFVHTQHTATLLPDGRVLVAGGYPNYARAEFYDPVTGSWSQTADLLTGVTYHTADLLNNGKVLVAYGNGGQVFDPGSALANTSTSVVSSLNPSAFSDQVTVTATVASGGAVTEGAVTFKEGGALLAGPLALNSNGQASFSTSSLNVGSHNITAEYSGSINFSPSSGSVVQAVNGTCTPTPANIVGWWHGDSSANDIHGSNHGATQNGATFVAGKVNQAFSLDGADDFVEIPNASNVDFSSVSPMTAEVWVYRTGSGLTMHILGKRDDCGDIQYQMAFDPGSGLAFGSFSGGVATHRQLSLNVWTHLAATFDGANYKFYIDGELAGTGTGALGPSYPVPLKIGAAGTCGGNFGGLIDELAFYNRALTETEVQNIYNASSAGKCRVINTSTSVASIPSPSTFGDSVTFTATVNGVSTVTEGGVIFKQGAMVLAGPYPLDSGGQATFSTSSLNAGSHTVTAEYSGSINFNPSSGSVVQTVNRANQTINFGALANKTYGDPPFSVNAIASSGLPVSFSVVSGPATIAGDTVTISGAGTVVVRASQSGDANFNASSYVDQSFAVNRASTATILVLFNNPSVAGQPVAFTATITSGSGTPGGVVEFKDGSTSLGTAAVSGGNASLTTSALSAGSHSITAVYSGNANFLGSTSSTHTQTVAAPTPPGSNVPVQTTVGSTTITTTFSNVTSGGTMSVTPIDPVAAGTLPGGFNLSGGSLAFEIKTTATFLGSAKICFEVPSITDPTQFANVRILHSVGKLDLAVPNFSSNSVSTLLGNGTGGFGPTTNVSGGSAPASVAVGDFNADGKQDLAVANYNSNNVSIRLGNGTGGFGTATNFTVGSNPVYVAVGDFNADGKQDLVTANYASNNVSIRLGNGTGSFGPATNFSAAAQPVSIAIGDFNADGKQDLAVANYNSQNVSIRLGTGTGGFGAITSLSVASKPHAVAIGDFNSDGKQDLVTANGVSNTVSIRLGNGSGGFGAATNFTVGSNPHSVAIGDFNADGKHDIAVANENSNNVSIRLGNGTGGLGAVTNFAVGSNPRSVVIGDFNADGKQDLASANNGASSVSIRLGNGAGGFGAATTFSVATNPYSLAVGNFNGDTVTVDQTILSGPNAPNFATKTICASVLSFSPFVLADVVDHSPPAVAASLTPVGQVGSNMGQFRVGFNATDDFDPAPAVDAVMESPPGTDSFQVVFIRANVDEAVISFDMDRQRIALAGRDEAELRGLLATVRGNGGAIVTQNQVLLLNRWPGQQFSFLFRNGVLIGESAPTIGLKVRARDVAANEGVATAAPMFSQ